MTSLGIPGTITRFLRCPSSCSSTRILACNRADSTPCRPAGQPRRRLPRRRPGAAALLFEQQAHTSAGKSKCITLMSCGLTRPSTISVAGIDGATRREGAQIRDDARVRWPHDRGAVTWCGYLLSELADLLLCVAEYVGCRLPDVVVRLRMLTSTPAMDCLARGSE